MVQSNRRLLMFNLMTDVNDPVLGFTTAWIRELATHYEAIDVITMYKGEIDLPDNVQVFSAEREHGLSKPLRVIMFYRHLTRLLMTRRYDVCFAHMMPLFAGLAGPLLSLRGIRTVLWYTHRQKSSQLKLGMAMSWRVVTAVPTSFPYETPKLRVIGHGINTDFYTPSTGDKPPATDKPIIVQVARLASIKHQDTAIKAIAKTDAHLVLVGDVQAGYPTQYKDELHDLACHLHIADRVTFAGDLSAIAVRDQYQQSTIAINMSPVGLFDKAALESMACGIPTIVCNPAFAALIGDDADLLIVDTPQDVQGLQDRLNQLMAMSDEQRQEIGLKLRAAVIQHYSLPHLTRRLVQVLQAGELAD